MESQRITDMEVFDLIAKIDQTEDETMMKDIIKTLLAVVVDTRILVRKVYQTLPKQSKVYTKPTGNAKDVIVG